METSLHFRIKMMRHLFLSLVIMPRTVASDGAFEKGLTCTFLSASVTGQSVRYLLLQWNTILQHQWWRVFHPQNFKFGPSPFPSSQQQFSGNFVAYLVRIKRKELLFLHNVFNLVHRHLVFGSKLSSWLQWISTATTCLMAAMVLWKALDLPSDIAPGNVRSWPHFSYFLIFKNSLSDILVDLQILAMCRRARSSATTHGHWTPAVVMNLLHYSKLPTYSWHNPPPPLEVTLPSSD